MSADTPAAWTWPPDRNRGCPLPHAAAQTEQAACSLGRWRVRRRHHPSRTRHVTLKTWTLCQPKRKQNAACANFTIRRQMRTDVSLSPHLTTMTKCGNPPELVGALMSYWSDLLLLVPCSASLWISWIRLRTCPTWRPTLFFFVGSEERNKPPGFLLVGLSP